MSGAVLGIDLGSVRIGVAICEGSGLPAVPLTTLTHTNRTADVDAIVRLAAQRGANRIVVGYPIALDGTPGPAAKKAEVFMAQLRAQFSGEVLAQDERLTTAVAAKKLRALSASGSKRRRHLDEVAAVEILSSFLAREGRS